MCASVVGRSCRAAGSDSRQREGWEAGEWTRKAIWTIDEDGMKAGVIFEEESGQVVLWRANRIQCSWMGETGQCREGETVEKALQNEAYGWLSVPHLRLSRQAFIASRYVK